MRTPTITETSPKARLSARGRGLRLGDAVANPATAALNVDRTDPVTRLAGNPNGGSTDRSR